MKEVDDDTIVSKGFFQPPKICPAVDTGESESNEEVMEFYLSNANVPSMLNSEKKTTPKTTITIKQKLVNLKNRSFKLISRGNTKKNILKGHTKRNLYEPENTTSTIENEKPAARRESKVRRFLRQLSSFGRTGSTVGVEDSEAEEKASSPKIAPSKSEKELLEIETRVKSSLLITDSSLSPEQEPGKKKSSRVTYVKYMKINQDDPEAMKRQAIDDLTKEQERQEREEEIRRLKQTLKQSKREAVPVKGVCVLSERTMPTQLSSSEAASDNNSDDNSDDDDDDDEDAALYKPVGIF